MFSMRPTPETHPNLFPPRPDASPEAIEGHRIALERWKNRQAARRLALRSVWFSAKERAYDLWSLTLPIFLVMGVLVLSARFWCWLVGW